jgi:hypothetical protein
MTKSQLQELIRNSLNKQIKETIEKAQNPPTTFFEFRKAIAKLFAAANAPEPLISEVADVDHECAGVASALYRCWVNIDEELKHVKTLDESKQSWNEISEYYIRDLIVDVINEFNDSENYATNRRAQKIDVDSLTNEVISMMHKIY